MIRFELWKGGCKTEGTWECPPGRPIRKKVSGGNYKNRGSEDENSEQSGDSFRSGNAI